MLRTAPWCFARISSTRCRADRMLSVPDSAWLTSSKVDNRRDSLAFPAAGFADRVLAMLSRAGTDYVFLGDGHRFQERHHGAELGADPFDPLRALLAALAVEPRTPGGVLLDPSARVPPAADVLEHVLHFLARLLGHDARSTRVVAVFRGIAHRVAHVVEAALINQIDDELQLVETLEIRDLRLIARLHQRLEAGLDERAHAAAQHRLLAEQVRFRFLGERRLDDAGSSDADGLCIRQRELLGLPGGVLVDRDERRRAASLDIELADPVTRRLRRHHRHVHTGPRRACTDADV